MDALLVHYPTWLANLYYGGLLTCLLLELMMPVIASHYPKLTRCVNNLLIGLCNNLLAIILPLTVVALAMQGQMQGWGLFNLWRWDDSGIASELLMIAVGVLLLDCADYGLHRLSHQWPVLWRLHQVHHSDPDIDVTTEVRHHPVEMLVGYGWAMSVVLLLGLAPLSVVIHRLLRLPISLFSHISIEIHPLLDRLMRPLFITPDMHRVHHSSYQVETDSNYGTLFSWWDRLFNSYTARPRNGLAGLEFGLKEHRSARALRLDRMLLMPFMSAPKRQAQGPDDPS